MSVRWFLVDAFTDRAFRGNPAAVCLLERPAEPAWMQSLAAEVGVSETAFLEREPEARTWRLRWFTPAVEVALCGHATLASTHVLVQTGALDTGATASFLTRSGRLRATAQGDRIALDFPAIRSEPGRPPASIASAVRGEWIDSRALDEGGIGKPTWIVELPAPGDVIGLRPELSGLRAPGAPCLIVTARGSPGGEDFVSRFFAPAVGIDEDPVTGSAHCALAPYWAAKLGRASMTGFQASARGGRVAVTLAGDRVELGGTAVTIVRGELAL